MKYCVRCTFPENAKPDIIFDKKNVCSGCNFQEQKLTQFTVAWDERKRWLKEILDEHKARAKEEGRLYDCILPISGGKDSYFQVYMMKVVYGMSPLLVTYNHGMNSKIGNRNLRNLVQQFDCHLIRFTQSADSARRISRWSLKRVGDITWAYHAGIPSFPFQIAVRYKIPLVLFGEEGFSEIVGMFSPNDMVEHSRKKRQEHALRGFEPIDVLEDELAIKEGITPIDLEPFFYPSDESIEELGVRGIYLGNYLKWDAKKQTEKMIKEYGFETARKKQLSFDIHSKLDDLHAEGVHSYLKFLKFGYGRCTDNSSNEIRMGRITRDQGIDYVLKYDHLRPHDLDIWLKFAKMTEQEFYDSIEHLREKDVWEKKNGTWRMKDNIGNHRNDKGVKEAELPLIDKHEFIESKHHGDQIKEYKNFNKQNGYEWL